jgi:hypothetical protein
MSSFKDHFLDGSKVKEGVKLPLFDKGGGISKDYLMVRWVWDDKVRAALDNLKREGQRRITQIRLDMSPEEKKKAEAKNKTISDELVLDGFVAQVAGWSFDEKPTKANLLAFIKARPDVAERIDTVAATTKLFFTDSGASSSSGRKLKSA